MTTRTRVAALAGAVLLALPGAASAAEPAEGTLDLYDTPRVEWTGETYGGAINNINFFGELVNEGQTVDECAEPFCDTFTLTVPEGAKKLKVSAEDAGYTEVQIKDAAGEVVFYSTGEAEGATVWTKSKPKAGTYTVEVITDAFDPEGITGDVEYVAFAEINDGVKTPRPEAQG
jgi:hypothetical protein